MSVYRSAEGQSLFSHAATWIQGLLSRIGFRSLQPKVKRQYESIIRLQLGPDYSHSQVEDVFLTPQGILVFFHATTKTGSVQVFVNLFETSHPDHALFEHPKEIYTIGNESDGWNFVQLLEIDRTYLAYWTARGQGTREIVYPSYLFTHEVELRQAVPLLEKPQHNPILSPAPHNDWEAFCTFNPAAVYANDQVHLLYRAQGHDYVSQIGYAVSTDGVTIQERLDEPAYRPSQPFEGFSQPPGDPNNPFVSGGGCGGCEDPRATIIDGRVYMTYVAYNGWDHPRIALTSIDLGDFLAQRFLWEKPVLISQPGVVDKSACIFPEKINNKFVILHRVFPDILIDYVDSLDFSGEQFLEGQQRISPRSREWWDSRKIGAGAPPLKTDIGWLLIYQAVDDKDASQYKIGAMLLDLNDPSKVLYRCAQPILEPSETYENNGFKAGVVYPCGAVIKDDTLFVYYGGADSYVCVATANLADFLDQLTKTGHPHLDSATLGLSNQPKSRNYFYGTGHGHSIDS